MDFRATTVAPQGRNKYGNYMSSSNVTKAVAVTTYGGNAAGGGGAPTPEPLPDDSFVLFLSKTNETYDVSQFGGVAFEDTISITGYNNTYKAHTYVGDLSRVLENDPETGEPIIPEIINNDIECSDPKVQLTVNGNGTDNTSITMRFPDGYIPLSGGTLGIPVSIYMGKELNPEDGNYDSYGLWYSLKTDCVSMWFTFTWNITSNASTTEGYVIDLSNEMAEINADAEGNIYANSKRPDDCEIKLFKGIELMTAATCNVQAIGATATGWTYSYSEENGYTTIHFNQVGHANPFNFEGEAMSFKIDVLLDGALVGTRFMKISKNKAGADGTSPVTRWITTNPNEITIDVNTDPYTYSSTNIVATVWKQEGENTPVADNDTIGYWWYDGESIGNRTFRGSVDVPLNATISGVTFGLLKSDGNRTIIKDYYELEDIPFIYSGKNGQDGNDSDVPGPPGESGQSVYTLVLSNQSSGINCDAEGNPYPSSIATLQCKATLYYGKTPVVMRGEGENEFYDIIEDENTTIHNIGIDNITGNLGFSNMYFDQGAKNGSVRVQAFYDGETFETILRLYKVLPGADGTSPTNRWLNLSSTEILADNDNPVPDSLTATALKQTGNGIIEPDSEAIIEYFKWHRTSSSPDTGHTYTGQITLTSEDIKDYFKYEFILKYDGKVIDRQDCMFLKNGSDGKGERGLQGPTVRGPVEWIDDGMEIRDFECGDEEAEERFIDIVFYNGHYYRCIRSFTSYPTDVWGDVSKYFEQADAEYKFIATDLLLSREAKIKFLTNSEIHMVDDNDIIYGGMKAVNDDNDIIIWAGDQDPKTAPYQVNNEGEMIATKGQFGIFSIGKDESGNDAVLAESTGSEEGEETYNLTIVPNMITMSSGEDSIKIAPLYGNADGNGVIDIMTTNDNKYGLYTNAPIYTDGGLVRRTDKSLASGSHQYNPWCYLKDIDIVFIISDTSPFTSQNGTWWCKGRDTGISSSEFPIIENYVGGLSLEGLEMQRDGYKWIAYNNYSWTFTGFVRPEHMELSNISNTTIFIEI